MGWFKPEPPIVIDAREKGVCQHSPARLLADSLTDPETRGEWIRKTESASPGLGFSHVYENTLRDVQIRQTWALYGGNFVSTPFKLSDGELKIVRAALERFDDHLRVEREREAIARLTAPREGLKRDSGETSQKARSEGRKPGGKATRPKGKAAIIGAKP